jgi:hypothetical protein
MNKREAFDKKAEAQAAILNLPPVTVEQREAFIKWLSELEQNMTHLAYAIGPAKAWEDAPDETVLLNLAGNNGEYDLPKGMYCLDLPVGFNDKHRDAFALASVYFGNPYGGLDHFFPSFMSIALGKPTAHEVIEGKMFIRRLINNNKENSDLVEWANVLLT